MYLKDVLVRSLAAQQQDNLTCNWLGVVIKRKVESSDPLPRVPRYYIKSQSLARSSIEATNVMLYCYT